MRIHPCRKSCRRMRRPGSRPTSLIRSPPPISIAWIMPARDSCSRRSAATPPRRGRKPRAISSHAAQSTRRSRTRRQSSSPMRSRRSTRSQRIRSSPTIAPRRRNWPRCLAFATRPQERARELERALLAPELPAALAVDLRDFLLLERTGTRNTDLGAWIYDIDILTTSGREQDVATAKTDALTRWREQRNLPWLVAALMHLSPGDEDVAAAIAASRAIEASSPAYYTLAWNRLRLLIGENKQEEARTEFDQILDGRPLPEGVENLMRYHRMKLARDLDEFARFALRRGEFVMYLPDPRTKLDATAPPLKSSASFPYDFGAILKW